jgi:hypothetical protein
MFLTIEIIYDINKKKFFKGNESQIVKERLYG